MTHREVILVTMNATSASKSYYNFETRELVGEKVCSYCGTLVRIVPLAKTPESWHGSAECVAGVEPIR